MSDFSPEQLQALSDAIGKLNDTLNPTAQGLANLGSSAAGAASSLSGVNLNPLQKAAASAALEATSSTKAIKLLGDSASAYSKAFLSGQKGTGKYAEAVSSAGDAIETFGKRFGPLGQAAAMAAGALFKLAASSLKQNDALISTYQKFSDFGAIDEKGTASIKDLTHKFGVTAETMGNLHAVLAGIAPDMVAFGGSVKGGIDKFANFNKELLFDKQGTELVLKKMGLSTEQITEYAGKFVVDQTKYGIAQGKSVYQLKDSFVDLMKVTTELADITGTSRDAQMKQLEENQRDVRWRMYLAGLDPKEAAMKEKLLLSYQALSKGAGELYKDQMASGGAVTSQYTAMQRNIYGNLQDQGKVVEEQVKQGKDFGLAMAEQFKRSGMSMEQFLGRFMGGKFTLPTEALQALGIGTDTLNAKQKIASMNINDLAEKFRKIAAETDKRLKDGVKQEKAERNSLMMTDDLTYAVGDLAVPAITNMAWITNKVNEGLAGFLKLITRGKTDYTAQFKTLNSLDEANDALQKAKKEELDLAKEKLEIDTKLQDNNKKILDNEANPTAFGYKLNKSLLEAARTALLKRQSENEEKTAANRTAQGNANAAAANYGAKEESKASDYLNFTSGSGDAQHFLKLNGAFREQILTAAKNYNQTTGKKLTVNSAYRSDDEQADIYQRWLDAGGGPNKPTAGGITTPAKPQRLGGTGSNHSNAMSIDINEQDAAALKALRDAGLRRNVAGDDVHWSAANGGVFRGPKTGYTVQLHGHEAVVPMSVFNNYLKGMNQPDASANVVKNTLHNTMPSITNPQPSSDLGKMFTDLFEMMADKMNDMIEQQRKSLHVNEQILSQAKH